jgi:hypothetical protein
VGSFPYHTILLIVNNNYCMHIQIRYSNIIKSKYTNSSMESPFHNPTTQNAAETGYFPEQTKLNKTEKCNSSPAITHFT